MRSFNKSVVSFLSGLILSIFQSYANGFSNPISPYSPEDYANPSVVYDNGYYYAVNAENNCSRIVVYKSIRLEDLYYSSKVTVWTAPAGTDHCEAIWAPYLQYVQGNWYIYYTATWNGVLKYHRMFALKAMTQDPQGIYDDCGSVYAKNTDFYAIDGKVIVKPTDGSLYFVWSGSPNLPYQNIYIAPMDNPTHINGSATMISGNTASWENEVHEAPAFICKDGKSIITYSTGELLNPGAAGYKMGTLTNTDGNYLDPTSWIKSSSAVFQCWTGMSGSVYAPGACCFIKSPNGTEDWLIYHAKHFSDYNYNREIRAQKFTWDSNDNPLFDHPVPSGVILAAPDGQDPNPSEITSGAVYKIVARHSSKALTVIGSSMDAGALLEQREYNETPNQNWVITDVGNGYYKIVALHSGLSLNVSNYSIDNGANIIQQVYTGYDDEFWKICNLGNRYYLITSKHSQKCLDIVNASTLNGALLNQWPFFGNSNQEWQLTKLSPNSTTDLDKNFAFNINTFIDPENNSLIVEPNSLNAVINCVDICDLTGHILKYYLYLNQNRIQINISDLPNSIYILRIGTNNRIYNKKMIIKR